MDALSERIRTLPDVAAPSSLRPAVMARIAQQPDGSRLARRREPASPRAGWAEVIGWLSAAAGLIAVVIPPALSWFTSGVRPDVFGPRIGGLTPTVSAGSTSPLIAAGLLLYLVGLLLPLRGGRPTGRT